MTELQPELRSCEKEPWEDDEDNLDEKEGRNSALVVNRAKTLRRFGMHHRSLTSAGFGNLWVRPRLDVGGVLAAACLPLGIHVGTGMQRRMLGVRWICWWRRVKAN